jgi:hypothetical protein
MPWPTLVELHDRNVSITSNGGLIENIFYVEPSNAAPAVMSALLGRVPKRGYSERILPAHDPVYRYFYCDEAVEILFDQRQVSYYASTNLVPDADNLNSITSALQNDTNGSGNQDGKYEIYPIANVKQKKRSAGIYVKAIYRPLYTAYTGTKDLTKMPLANQEKLSWDYLNPKWEAITKKHVVNKKLFVQLAPVEVWNPLPGGAPIKMPFSWPDTGLSPHFEEVFQRLTIERKMVYAQCDFGVMNAMMMCVNSVKMNGGTVANKDVIWPEFDYEQCKFINYSWDVVRVPGVDDDTGDSSGWNTWINVKLTFDIRNIRSNAVYNRSGVLVQPSKPGYPISWNHMLLCPSAVRRGVAALNGTPNKLGWYFVGYTPNVDNWDTPDISVYRPADDLKKVFEHQ